MPTTKANKYTAGLLKDHDDWTDGHILNEAAALRAGAILRRALDDPALDDSDWIGLAEDIRHALGCDMVHQQGEPPPGKRFAHGDTNGFICAVSGIKKSRGKSIGPFFDDDYPDGNPVYLDELPMLAQFIANHMSDADSVEPSTSDQPAESSLDSDESPISLDKKQKWVMAAMARSELSDLLSLDTICTAAASEGNVSERTAGTIVKKFISLKLAERPQGDKKGARLTTRGRRLATKIAQAKIAQDCS